MAQEDMLALQLPEGSRISSVYHRGILGFRPPSLSFCALDYSLESRFKSIMNTLKNIYESFSILLIGTRANILYIVFCCCCCCYRIHSVSEKVAFLVLIFFTNTYSLLLEQVAHLFDSVHIEHCISLLELS